MQNIVKCLRVLIKKVKILKFWFKKVFFTQLYLKCSFLVSYGETFWRSYLDHSPGESRRYLAALYKYAMQIKDLSQILQINFPKSNQKNELSDKSWQQQTIQDLEQNLSFFFCSWLSKTFFSFFRLINLINHLIRTLNFSIMNHGVFLKWKTFLQIQTIQTTKQKYNIKCFLVELPNCFVLHSAQWRVLLCIASKSTFFWLLLDLQDLWFFGTISFFYSNIFHVSIP